MPIPAMRSTTSGDFTAAITARLSRATISRGVRAATNTPAEPPYRSRAPPSQRPSDLGCEIRALRHAEREHAQLSALDGASRSRVADETELNVARDHRRNRLARALERHVGEIGSGIGLEELHRDVVDGTIA